MLKINKHPNLKSDIFEHHPMIIPVRRFTEPSLEEFTRLFMSAEQSGQEIIPIHIDSNGGNVDSLFGMLDVIGRSKKIVCTFTNTKAYSCGAVLLAAGTQGYRFASTNSSIMVHEISAGAYGKQTDVNNDVVFFEGLNARLLAIMDSLCNKDKGFFKASLHEQGNADIYYTATQAKKAGIIDSVKSPSFEIELSQEFKLC